MSWPGPSCRWIFYRIFECTGPSLQCRIGYFLLNKIKLENFVVNKCRNLFYTQTHMYNTWVLNIASLAWTKKATLWRQIEKLVFPTCSLADTPECWTKELQLDSISHIFWSYDKIVCKYTRFVCKYDRCCLQIWPMLSANVAFSWNYKLPTCLRLAHTWIVVNAVDGNLLPLLVLEEQQLVWALLPDIHGDNLQ